jgi:arylsulfatase A-like enzyme
MNCLRIFLTLLLALSLLCVGESATAAQPNIVLVMADDQGWGDVGHRGNPVLKTPVFDELAKTALCFDRFYAAHPVCSPTRGSVLTGRNPNRFGCYSWGYTLRPQENTVAELLQAAGYRTGHFGKWHVGDVRDGHPTSPGENGFHTWISAPNFFENSPLLSNQGTVERFEGESSHVVADEAIKFMKSAVSEEKPFLAVVWFGSPHQPHIAAPEFKKQYSDQPAKQQDFLGEVTGMDHAVGELREALGELGVRENTLFWYTSDNGVLPVGYKAGLAGGKGNLAEGGIRVPCYIEWPAVIKTPRTVQSPACTVDILPTVLAAAGVKIPTEHPLDGESLLPLIEAKESSWSRKKPLGFWIYQSRGISTPSEKMLAELKKQQEAGNAPEVPKDVMKQFQIENLPKPDLDYQKGSAALIDGDWKLRRDGQKAKLFNLAEDPGEKNDLAKDQPERAASMDKLLSRWQRSVVQSLRGEDYASE